MAETHTDARPAAAVARLLGLLRAERLIRAAQRRAAQGEVARAHRLAHAARRAAGLREVG